MEATLLTPIFVITSGLALGGAALIQRRSRRKLEEARKALRPVRVRANERPSRKEA